MVLAAFQPRLFPPASRPSHSGAVGFSSLVPSRARELSQAVWVDARPSQAYQRNRVPLAVNFPPDSALLPPALNAPERPIIVYSENGLGGEAERSADSLSRALHRSVFVLVGGLQGWRQAGGIVQEGLP